VLRTDFTDDDAWQALLTEIGDDWVTVLADADHQGLSVPELLALVPDGSRYPVLVVADATTFADAEHPLLLIDVTDEPGRTFRAGPEACRSAITNLAIENLGFEDYLDSVDDAGVYRLSDGYRRAMADLAAARLPDTGGHTFRAAPKPRS
jgi:hypothetical protein